PLFGVLVADRLVADVDQDVRLFAGEDVVEALPEVDRLVEAGRALLFAVAGGVVVLKDADDALFLAFGDDLLDALGGRDAPLAFAGAQDDADGVGAEVAELADAVE